MEDKFNYIEQLKEEVESKGYVLSKVAFNLGMHRSTLIRILSGKGRKFKIIEIGALIANRYLPENK